MPLFRRRPAEHSFTVGVDDHRVVVGGSQTGVELLDDIDGYVGAVASRGSTRPDGRDSIAVLNAKMDYAELADAAVTVLALALEDLTAQGFIAEEDIPDRPRRFQPQRDLPMYEHIQATYQRAQERMQWVRSVDELLRERGIAVLRPLPIEQRR
jgi:hypothetical protein